MLEHGGRLGGPSHAKFASFHWPIGMQLEFELQRAAEEQTTSTASFKTLELPPPYLLLRALSESTRSHV